MNLIQIVPPMAIPALLLIGILGVLLLLVESVRARRTKHTRQLIMQYARGHATKRVSVIVELTRRADTIFPLLDHLYAANYSKLEVIVVVKQTAGSKAKSALTSYRRKQQRKGLRVVTHRKGFTPQTIASKYISGELVLRLEPTDRLGEGFFTFASFHFIDSNLALLRPQSSPRLNQTLSSALAAIAALFTDSWTVLSRHSTPGVAVSQLPLRTIATKSQLIRNNHNTPTVPLYSNQLFITTNSRPAKQVSAKKPLTTAWYLRIPTAVFLLTCAVLLVTTAILSSVWFAFSVGLLSYSAILIALIVGSRSYGPGAKLNLVLFAPFSAAGFTLQLITKIWKQTQLYSRLVRSITKTVRLSRHYAAYKLHSILRLL